MEGRQFLDVSLIVTEVIDSMQKRKERGILCKLNIEKTCDQINWSFVLKVLKRMGFGEKWVGWIKWCMSIATFSVLLSFFKSVFEARWSKNASRRSKKSV